MEISKETFDYYFNKLPNELEVKIGDRVLLLVQKGNWSIETKYTVDLVPEALTNYTYTKITEESHTGVYKCSCMKVV